VVLHVFNEMSGGVPAHKWVQMGVVGNEHATEYATGNCGKLLMPLHLFSLVRDEKRPLKEARLRHLSQQGQRESFVLLLG